MGNLGPLRTEPFVAAIKRMGEIPAAWMRHEGECPVCQEAYGDFTPNPDCTLCGGVGVILTEQTLPTGATGGKLLLSMATVGKTRSPVELAPGDITCSFMEDEYPLEEGDRILLATRQARFSERIVRGSGSSDRLKHYPAVSVQSVYKAAGLVASAGYSIGATARTLVWTSGVSAGAQYTVSYWYRPAFAIVQGSIHHRVEATNGDLFPSRCVLRLLEQAPTDVAEGSY